MARPAAGVVRAAIPAHPGMVLPRIVELVGCICLVIQLPWMVGGTGFLVWEMIKQLTEFDDDSNRV
ncbi:hypothetical protein EMIT0158MI4_40085 [Burkholderia ambifaria]